MRVKISEDNKKYVQIALHWYIKGHRALLSFQTFKKKKKV